MYILAPIALAVVLFMFPTLRCAVFNPFAVLYNAPRDLWFYLMHKGYNNCPAGELLAYVALSDKPFGNGKTLSGVHRVVSDFKRYDGKTVWCPERKKFVTQRIKILSNVKLQIPYENFVSLEQIVYCAENNDAYDLEHNTLTVTLVLGDEFSVQMNSRNFKTNVDPLFLNTILTCRHYHISLFYTTQRFAHVDALLRQVTGAVIACNKLWRFQRQNVYDAWEMENATNPMLLNPLGRHCWFVRNRDYEAYNTRATVGNLKKSFKEGDMIKEEEILALQMNQQQTNMDGIVKPSRKWLRSQKKQQK